MAIIPSLPVNLQNGTTADATQVMSNFNTIVSDVNANAAHSGANSDITSLSGLTTPIPINEGGTGATTASTARTALGLGAAAVEALGNNIIDDGAGNLVVAPASILSSMLAVVALPNGSTGTTQAPGDNTTKVATDAFVTAAIAIVTAAIATVNARSVKGTTCTQNPITSNTQTTTAHGLSGAPNSYVAYLECITGEGGYSAGDRLPITNTNADGSTSAFTICGDATNTTISTFNPCQIYQVSKNAGTDFLLTNANWKIVAIPYITN